MECGLDSSSIRNAHLDLERIAVELQKEFLILPDYAVFTYKCTDLYDSGSEGGIPWNDPDINVQWPKLDILYKTSEKDEKHEFFATQDFSWAEKWLRA